MTENSHQASSLSIYRRLLYYARSCWFALCLGVIGTSLSSATDAGFTWLLKPLLDKGFIARDQHFIKWIPLGIIIFFILRGAAEFMSNYYINWSARRVVMRFRQQLFCHLLSLPACFI